MHDGPKDPLARYDTEPQTMYWWPLWLLEMGGDLPYALGADPGPGDYRGKDNPAQPVLSRRVDTPGFTRDIVGWVVWRQQEGKQNERGAWLPTPPPEVLPRLTGAEVSTLVHELGRRAREADDPLMTWAARVVREAQQRTHRQEECDDCQRVGEELCRRPGEYRPNAPEGSE